MRQLLSVNKPGRLNTLAQWIILLALCLRCWNKHYCAFKWNRLTHFQPWFPGRKNQQIRPYSHLNKFACGFGGAQNTQSTTICAGTQGSILMCFFPSYSVYSEPKGSFAQTQVRFTACSNTSQAAATPHQIHPTVQQQQVPAALGVPQWDFPVLHIIRCYGVIKADTLF